MRISPLASLAFLAALALGGCGHKGSKKLEGTWRGQKADGVGADVQAQANGFATGTQLVAKGDQIAITTPAAKPSQATYTVDNEDKTTVVIHTDRDGPNHTETFTFSDDGKTMIWRLDPQRSITFTRVGPAPQ